MDQQLGSGFDKKDYRPGPASQYVVPEHIDDITTNQVTVPRNQCWMGEDCCYRGILNEKGLQLLRETRLRAARKLFTDTLGDHTIDIAESGKFVRVLNEPPGSHQLPKTEFVAKTFLNRIVSGTRSSNGEHVTTSEIVLFDEYEGWALTKSGSLYALK